MAPGDFTVESPRPLALMRIALGAVLFVDAVTRWPFVVELYSTAGEVFPLFSGTVFAPPAFSPTVAVAAHTLCLFALIAVTIGWWTRTSLCFAATLTAYFALLDGVSTMTKYIAIAVHLLVLLVFTRCGGVWSVDALRQRFRFVPLSPTWPRWLMRVLVCVVYLGAAVTKLRLPDFATGDLLEFSLLDDAYGGTWLGQWLATQPALLTLASFAVVAFELMFPVLVWVPRLRRTMLLCAVVFHVGLWLTMFLSVFSPVMLAALLAFVEERDLPDVGRILKTEGVQPLGFPWVSALLFLASAAAVTVGGVLWQRSVDRYGVFDEKPPAAFPEVAPEIAQEMIDAYEPQYRDYFHRFEIGSRLGYRHAFGEQERFRRGQVVYVLTRLLQPHPALELIWELIPPDGSEPARFARSLEASASYASIGFRLDEDAPPGQYVIRLSAREPLTAEEVVVEIPFDLQ